jgi:hypothetical protein
MTKAVTAQTAEAAARRSWNELDLAPPTATDEHGTPLPVSENFQRIVRQAKIIGASDQMATAVAALLNEQGVDARVEHVRVDPGSPAMGTGHGDRRAHGPRRCAVPIIPAAPGRRVYRATGDELGDPLVTVTAPDDVVERDGWIPAAVMAGLLREHPG